MAVDDPYSTVDDSTHALEKSAVSYGDSEHYVETEDLRWSPRLFGIVEGDGTSLEDTTTPATPGEPIPPLDVDALREHVDNLNKENAELKRHVKRRTQALDAMRKAYIIDVQNLKQIVRDQVETPAKHTPGEANLVGIPSLDFRPVLQLYAPSGANLDMSPCDGCGGTMEIIHSDDKELMRLRSRGDELQAKVAEAERRLGCSNADFEAYRVKKGSLESEFTVLKTAMVREIMSLKKRLEGAGPEVITKLTEERNRGANLLKTANRNISELEAAAVDMRENLDRAAQKSEQVEEMQHILQKMSEETTLVVFERDLQTKAAEELRKVVASLKKDVQASEGANASLEKTLIDQQENERQSTLKLRTMLDASKESEASLLDELTAAREEYLANAFDSDCDSEGGGAIERRQPQAATTEQVPQSLPIGPDPAASHGEAEVFEGQPTTAETLETQTKSDQLLVLELTEELRKKEEELDRFRRMAERQREVAAREVDRDLIAGELEATTQQSEMVISTVEASAAAGEDILSGAYAKREAESSLEIEELRRHLEEAKAKAHKAEKEKRGLMKMWEAARARLDALGGESGGSATEEEKPQSDGSGGPKAAKSERVRATKKPGSRRAGKASDGLKSQKNNPTEKDARKKEDSSSASAEAAEGDDAASNSDYDDDDQEDIMTKAIRVLEEDCRKLRVEKQEVQECCSELSSQLQSLRADLEKAQSSLEQERKAKHELEQDLEVRCELLHKATVSIAELSMALHDANAATEKANEQLQLEKQKSAELKNELKQVSSLNGVLDASLLAANVSLEVLAATKREIEAQLERKTLEAEKIAVRAGHNACWAEAEGMRAEEAVSRRFLADTVAAETMAAITSELKTCQVEVERQRIESEELAEKMKSFQEELAARVRLEKQVAVQHEQIALLRQKAAAHEAVIEELRVEVELLNTVREHVLRLEDKQQELKAKLLKMTASLEAAREEHKATERKLREKNGQNRSLSAALSGTILLLDDWCSGPLLEWREAADGRGDSSPAPSKPPVVPLEARRVDNIMKQRCAGAGGDTALPPVPAKPKGKLRAKGEGGAAPPLSIEEKLEGQRPNELKAWIDFRVCTVAAAQHNNRVDGALAEHALLDSICKQRAAQISNVEEALRQLEVERAALEKENGQLLMAKDELTATVSSQNETLADNSKQLVEFDILKVDHQDEIRRHQNVVRHLNRSESTVEGLKARAKEAAETIAAAKMAVAVAERVRSKATGEREVAQQEAKLAVDKMKREEKQAESVRKKLHDLVEADELRLATNKAASTEVVYGDFTDETNTQTTFLCPELTMRQMQRLPAVRGFVAETVGRYHPAPKYPDALQHFANSKRRLGRLPRPGGEGGLEDVLSYQDGGALRTRGAGGGGGGFDDGVLHDGEGMVASRRRRGGGGVGEGEGDKRKPGPRSPVAPLAGDRGLPWRGCGAARAEGAYMGDATAIALNALVGRVTV